MFRNHDSGNKQEKTPDVVGETLGQILFFIVFWMLVLHFCGFI